MPDSVRPCRNYVELHIILLYFPAFCDTILILINFTAENSRWNINIFAKVFPAKSPQIHPTISEFAEYVQSLMADPALSWRDAVKQFLHACCYGEKNGIAVLTIEEQQLIFKRLSKECYQVFRQKQRRLFDEILENFGIRADAARINLFTNLSLTVMVVRRAIPSTLPLFVPEAADETVDFQLNGIVDTLEKWKTTPAP